MRFQREQGWLVVQRKQLVELWGLGHFLLDTRVDEARGSVLGFCAFIF